MQGLSKLGNPAQIQRAALSLFYFILQHDLRDTSLVVTKQSITELIYNGEKSLHWGGGEGSEWLLL